jgi:hypothetical protein
VNTLKACEESPREETTTKRRPRSPALGSSYISSQPPAIFNRVALVVVVIVVIAVVVMVRIFEPRQSVVDQKRNIQFGDRKLQRQL